MTDTMASLFSGGKLFDIGAMAAGLRPLWGVEYKAKIAAVDELNVPAPCIVGRVEETDYSQLETPWLLHASPECTRASQANSAGGESEVDLAMAQGVIVALRTLRPRVFTLENVFPYRNFQSFKNILAALDELGYAHNFWHLNAADYGVPQTRKRLILMASQDFTPRPPKPTHHKGGSLYHPPWIGWYAAIADIIHTLPRREPAPWQQRRIPRAIRESMIFAQGQFDGQLVTRRADDPALTLTANSNQTSMRAYIVGGGNTNMQEGEGAAGGALDPMFTVAAQGGEARNVRALLVESENAGSEWGKGYREGAGSAPSLTARATYPRAYLVDGDNARPDTGEPTTLAAWQPAMTMRGGPAAPHRAFLMQGTSSLDIREAAEPSAACVASVGAKAAMPKAFVGYWVGMTIQAMGRFQTTPDSYQGLTNEINGNGVPPELSRHICVSAHQQEQRARARRGA